MQEIYLDNSATTRVLPEVAEVALSLMLTDYGNPSSLHRKGLNAQLRLDHARRQVAAALDCSPTELVFTSGGTEANNLALFGAARALHRRGKTIVSTRTEHSSVLAALRRLEEEGFTVRLVPPRGDGTVDPRALADAVDGDTVLVSCMLVNSEVGSINPVARIAKLSRRKSPHALIHCDGVQAPGKLPLSMGQLGVDLFSISGHKFHAPKGCGALYIRREARIVPALYGGPQENGLRAGTESTPLHCAMGLAAEIARRDLAENLANVESVCKYFVNKACELPGVCINSPAGATPYICNLSLPGYRSEILLHYLEAEGIYVSSGSACSKGASSHVLTAMGLHRSRVDSALRVSFSRHSTKEEADALLAALEQGMQVLARQA